MEGIILGGRYELLEKIGEGGMSEVYKARCNKLKRFVAVKILKKEFADNEEIAQKFQREATAIANLSDTNIVNVLDVGTQDKMEYIVMEYVKGKTLKELIKYTGKLNYNSAIKIAMQIAKALDCAHRNDIIHRDIKPQNILITELGEVKVTDFGIAKSTNSETITNTTSIIGSAHYLSPEQAKGTYIDFRSDIYSFGIVLYEMVTGKLPFEGDSPVTVALKHLQEEPIPPKNINSSIPDSLNKLILKCMKKEPIKRYQNIKEIIQDLQKIQENPDVIIGNNLNESDNDNTIIMAPITSLNTSNINKASISKSDEYEDELEEEYDDEYDDEYEDKKNKKKSSLKKVLIGIGVVILILLLGSIGFFLAEGGITDNNDVEVPELVGKLADDAIVQLEELGLKLEIKSTEKSDKPENTILETDPKAGMNVKKGTVINVIVSAGEELIEMPDFRDYERTNIEQILKSNNLTNYTITEEYNDTVDTGYLISQSPAAGTEVSSNTSIQIVVSKGPEITYIYVEDVVGKTLSEAQEILKGLNVSTKEEVTNDESEDGIVLSQDNTGKNLEEGSTVTLVIGKYEAPMIDIRNEVGISEGQTLIVAKSRAEGAGFKVNVRGPKDDDAIVTSFTEAVEPGGTIIINTEKAETPTEDENAMNNENNNGNNNGNEDNEQ